MSEGLDLAIRQVKALEFLENVGGPGGVLEFKEKIETGEEGFLRIALISHLRKLFRFSTEEANETIIKFIGGC